jgi:hypothetical protein
VLTFAAGAVLGPAVLIAGFTIDYLGPAGGPKPWSSSPAARA